MSDNQEVAVQTIEHYFQSNQQSPPTSPATLDDSPKSVQESFSFHSHFSEERDFSMAFLRVESPVGLLYLVATIPDGNDGVFEVFTPDGVFVGAGQFLLRNTAWGSTEEVRSIIQTGGFLPGLKPALIWVQLPDGSYQSQCQRFTIQPSDNQWVLAQMPEQGSMSLENAKALANQVAPFFTPQ